MNDQRIPWPKDPYKGLAYYGAGDRLLFSGRDEDVDACIYRLTSPETRVLLLHGQTGCGKSSFLRAGLIPNLEETGYGYFFLRDATDSPVFIRCGADPIARIAEELFRFASRPLALRTVSGDIEQRDLSDAIQGADLASHVEACRDASTLKKSLHAISAKHPCTLVIVLDQAEEVITLNDGSHSDQEAHRRREEFFSFFKEFSTINFPVKFVIALRKDYSGQFIELAQMGGSVDLRPQVLEERRSDGTLQDRQSVKSDIKLFLLPELRPKAVLRAIELPTSKEPVFEMADAGAPFDAYGFSYAPDVAERIVSDLFDASSTAVLPVMQIVCRELYNDISARSGPHVIDLNRYSQGGGISGPVDRHISKSLKASFRGTVPQNAADAENRWREVLYTLVQRESDGSVHTRIVDLDKLKETAAQSKAPGDVQAVVDYLTQPDVLLLRSAPLAANANGGAGFSLGHDFIAMVLNRWKVSRQELELAEQRMAKIRKNAILGIAAVAVAAFVAVFSAMTATKIENTRQIYDVLVKTAEQNRRNAVPMSVLTSAYASNVAKELPSLYKLWKKKDDRADRILAQLLAGLPDMTFAAVGAKTPTTTTTFPLTLSGGFLSINGDAAEVISRSGSSKFKLAPLAGKDLSTEVSETDQGTILLLRTSSSSLFRDAASSTYQLYFLQAGGELRGPFDTDYLFKKIGYSGADAVHAQNSINASYQIHQNGYTQLVLSGGLLVALTWVSDEDLGKAVLQVQAFAPDPSNANDPLDPRLRLPDIPIDAQFAERGGLPRPVPFGKYLVVPETGLTDPSAQRFIEYDMSSQAAEAKEIVADEVRKPCPGGCEWQWISTVGSENGLLVFAAPSERAIEPSSYFDATVSKLNNSKALRIIDPATGDDTVVDAVAVNLARAQCTPEPSSPSSQTASLLPEGSNSKVFIVGAPGASLLGVVTANSVDLLRIDRTDAAVGTVACIGTLGFFGRLNRWALTRDAKSLLGMDTGAGARWMLGEIAGAKADNFIKENKLVDHACASGLSDMIPNLTDADWAASTRLPTLPRELCKPTAQPVLSGAASIVN